MFIVLIKKIQIQEIQYLKNKINHHETSANGYLQLANNFLCISQKPNIYIYIYIRLLFPLADTESINDF